MNGKGEDEIETVQTLYQFHKEYPPDMTMDYPSVNKTIIFYEDGNIEVEVKFTIHAKGDGLKVDYWDPHVKDKLTNIEIVDPDGALSRQTKEGQIVIPIDPPLQKCKRRPILLKYKGEAIDFKKIRIPLFPNIYFVAIPIYTNCEVQSYKLKGIFPKNFEILYLGPKDKVTEKKNSDFCLEVTKGEGDNPDPLNLMVYMFVIKNPAFRSLLSYVLILLSIVASIAQLTGYIFSNSVLLPMLVIPGFIMLIIEFYSRVILKKIVVDDL